MILSVPQRLGLSIVPQEVVTTILGFAVAAAFIKHPYGEKTGLLELLLGFVAIATWMWSSFHYEAWIIDMADRTPDKWVPGVFAILLMMEALRKASGLPIAILVWVIIAYAFFGQYLPGVFEAEPHSATKTILYNYADSNSIPGLVLRIITTIVLAFIIFGRLMEVSGATKFFTDMAMGWMGHRRGGPAKVAVVASSAFGMVSGSTVGNIMSTGVVTIPLMKKSGFRSRYAAAIEAVASNGGQIAPPVMGTTAFLIAEFLEVSYATVVIAAIIPAALYYLVLFLQVDAIAKKNGLDGIPKEDLPQVIATLVSGWLFLIPLAVLMYFLFYLGFNPALSAVYAIAALFVLMVVKQRSLPTSAEWGSFIFGSGENLVSIVLIGGAAGLVIGILNSTGLGFQLALLLSSVGSLLLMLILTAMVSIVLGMGMPTAAVYIVLSIVLAPAMSKMGVNPMAAHLFLFYFGLLSMLTPPVAVASYVAAGLAGSNMWATGMVGIQLASTAYLLPFLWVYNPALIFEGTPLAIAYAVGSAIIAAFMLARAVLDIGGDAKIKGIITFAAALAVGGSTVWFGQTSPIVLIAIALGIASIFVLRAQEAKTLAAVQ
ncbi:MAG: TRAP transporter fused permease subunit [Rhodospirillaceae bacterium]|nr:TRAP transporter fused permease subunit [Rhodospirillaceae bacterium]